LTLHGLHPPGALTFGANREEALLRAPDAIETVLMGFNGRPPRHSDAPRRLQKALCNPTGIDGAKLALYTAMRTARVSKAELARRLNWHLPQLDRVLDLRHASRFDELEAGFRTLGKQLSVRVSEAA
jgi:antitoxin HicB